NVSAEAAGGAGPQAAQLLAGLDVDAVALGNVGPNAAAALEAAKIKVYSGVAGTVETTMQKFMDGKLTPVSEATVSSHSGMRGRKGGWNQ
ncbi:MAG: NifB/NifX family molybdenum-iron cluster-binding protein, partial [Bacillota bacterium]